MRFLDAFKHLYAGTNQHLKNTDSAVLYGEEWAKLEAQGFDEKAAISTPRYD